MKKQNKFGFFEVTLILLIGSLGGLGTIYLGQFSPLPKIAILIFGLLESSAISCYVLVLIIQGIYLKNKVKK